MQRERRGTCSSTEPPAGRAARAPGASAAANGSAAGSTTPRVPLPPKASRKNAARVRLAAASARVVLPAANASVSAPAPALQAASSAPPCSGVSRAASAGVRRVSRRRRCPRSLKAARAAGAGARTCRQASCRVALHGDHIQRGLRRLVQHRACAPRQRSAERPALKPHTAAAEARGGSRAERMQRVISRMRAHPTQRCR